MLKKIIDKIVVVLITVICGISCFFGVFKKFDFQLYDALLGVKDEIGTRDEILLVDIDDYSLDALGAWPWTRNIYADALIRMKELGASSAVFDIEFLSPSNNSDFDDYFAKSVQFFGNTWLTLNASDLGISYSDEDLAYSKNRFLVDVEDPENRILRGNIASALDTNNASFFEKFNFKKIDVNDKNQLEPYSNLINGFSPTMFDFISRANGAGFTNSFIDSDGSRRRIELLAKKDDKFLPQLVFAPMLGFLKPEKIIRTSNSLELKGVSIPNSEVSDISIPLDEDGRMLVNWKKSDFVDSFTHTNFYAIASLDSLESEIVSNLNKMNEVAWPGAELLSYKAKIEKFLSDYNDIQDYRSYLLSVCEGFDSEGNAISGGIDSTALDEYFSLRKSFFEELSNFSKNYEENELQEIENYLLDSIELYGQEFVLNYGGWFEDALKALKENVDFYNETFKEGTSLFKNAFCIIGHAASGTTDLGTTPFSRAYPNVGLHANIYNTILNQDFITSLNWIWGVIVSGILTLIFVGFIPSKKAWVQISCGILLIGIVIAIPIFLMNSKGIYVPMVNPTLIAVLSFLIVTAYRFMSAEKEKKFLQNTFGAYVSPEVVNEIVKNPDVAKLGGKSDELTALFSDVKTFSGFTEVINNEELDKVRKENKALPANERKSDEEIDLLGAAKGAERLVAILNDYLGVLSDAIMAEGGTIDKYVGDEIVSFFGAPIPDKNNAFNACVAGIRMLEAEAKFNEERKDILPINPQTGEPFYLHSRVGLNTGNMVVGNMGTDKKLNYTIMGNNVNLASRLEGTNKAYGSWIMVSESTWRKANFGENAGKLVARVFDAVRVVNVKRPVRIVNILGLRSEMSETRIAAADAFNEGMKWYMKGADAPETPKDLEDFKKAYSYYKKANELYPDDESSKIFMNRCADFIKNGIRGPWDGVYTMATK